MTNLRPCKGKDEAKLAAKQRTKCLNQMRACNGYVEKVLPTFENCNNNFLIDNINIISIFIRKQLVSLSSPPLVVLLLSDGLTVN